MSHKQGPNSPAKSECPCCACASKVERVWWMVVCDECGNKRCPHGSDHQYACSGSNEPGQTPVPIEMPGQNDEWSAQATPEDAIPATHGDATAQEVPSVIRELQAARETKWAEAIWPGEWCEEDLSTEEVRSVMALAAEETFEATSALRQELAQAKAEVERLRGQSESWYSGWKDASQSASDLTQERDEAQAREVSLRKIVEALADGVKDARANQQWIHADLIRAALAAEPTPAAEGVFASEIFRYSEWLDSQGLIVSDLPDDKGTEVDKRTHEDLAREFLGESGEGPNWRLIHELATSEGMRPRTRWSRTQKPVDVPAEWDPPSAALVPSGDDGCDCTELCSMGPTCPGGSLAGLDGSGCWRTKVEPTPAAEPHAEDGALNPSVICRRCGHYARACTCTAPAADPDDTKDGQR